jgi:hypothetical protein
MMSCNICVSADVEAINEMMLGGYALRKIGAQFGVGIASLSRHKPHLQPPTTEAITVVPFTGDEIEQLEIEMASTERLAMIAEKSGHLGVAVAARRVKTAQIELKARLKGVLNSTSGSTTILALVGTLDSVLREEQAATHKTIDIPKEIAQ